MLYMRVFFFFLTDDQVTMYTDWRAFEVIINRTFQSQAAEEEGPQSILSVSLDTHITIVAFSVFSIKPSFIK